MRGEKPEVNDCNIQACPNCGMPLNEISETYTTISINYQFDGSKYRMVSEPKDALAFKCNKCGNTLPHKVTEEIIKLLPKV